MSFVKLIDHMGRDLTVANAARVSFKKHKNVIDEKDHNLIKFLAKHNHWTPFGHCMATFHIKAPIYVARQLMKSQVGFVVNEVSRRYVDDEPEIELPTEWRRRAENKKQGSSEETVPHGGWSLAVDHAVLAVSRAYQIMLYAGVAPELARTILPLATLTEWYWTGSLAAWARLANLRLAPDAQVETANIVKEIDEELTNIFPCSWKALRE